MTYSSLMDFVDKTAERDRGQGVFEMENPRMLEVNLNNSLVWMKTGAMIAYNGDISFKREGMMEHGLGKMLKKAITGEGTRLTKAEGQGSLYIADMGKTITILNLNNDSLVVNGNNILAFESDVSWDIKLMKVSAMLAGGLTNVKLEGRGMVALTTHFEPLTLRVTPDKPVMTDPNATVAWSGNLDPVIKADISLRTVMGRGSGESLQMKFFGEGFVVVQPFEEVYFTPEASG